MAHARAVPGAAFPSDLEPFTLANVRKLTDEGLLTNAAFADPWK